MNPSLEQLQHYLDSGRLTISALDDGSGVVLDVEGEKLVSLNATGLAIVQSAADGAASEQDLAAALAERFAVAPDAARADVRTFLARLMASI